MEFFCYHRDRHGSTPLRERMVEQHWSYMDRFAETMIARGPTFAPDGTLTGSVHVLDLPDVAAARAFAFEEPGWQAGAYRDVLLRRWRNASGRTMWEFAGGRPDDAPDTPRYLVLGFTEPSRTAPEVPNGGEVIVGGPLLSDDGSTVLGAAVLLEAPDADRARSLLDDATFVAVEAHEWRAGGRSS
ncbi:YciI family protein [Intrasporangium sp. YIM S08009]|uniref:YciI family protein n=1 Tax=Intrasporangium zincisolvens TaxID=3080018 RepID=UPI002B0526D8|nr:YciI family protein [Intrasporangium sp. YIM S08009]